MPETALDPCNVSLDELIQDWKRKTLESQIKMIDDESELIQKTQNPKQDSMDIEEDTLSIMLSEVDRIAEDNDEEEEVRQTHVRKNKRLTFERTDQRCNYFEGGQTLDEIRMAASSTPVKLQTANHSTQKMQARDLRELLNSKVDQNSAENSGLADPLPMSFHHTSGKTTQNSDAMNSEGCKTSLEDDFSSFRSAPYAYHRFQYRYFDNELKPQRHSLGAYNSRYLPYGKGPRSWQRARSSSADPMRSRSLGSNRPSSPVPNRPSFQTNFFERSRSRSPGPNRHQYNRTYSPGRNETHFNRQNDQCPIGPLFNRVNSSGRKGFQFNRRNGQGPNGSHFNGAKSPGRNRPYFNRGNSLGPNGHNFNRCIGPDPSGSPFNRLRSPGPNGHNFNRGNSSDPSGSHFNRSKSPGPNGHNFDRGNSPGPSGSHFNRSRSPGPNGHNFDRGNSPGPSGSHFNRSRSPGPNGPNFHRGNSPGPNVPHFNVVISPGPNERHFNGLKNPGCNKSHFNRSNFLGPNNPHFNRSKSSEPNGPHFFRSRSPGQSGHHFNRSKSPGPNGSYFNQSSSPCADGPYFNRSKSSGPNGPHFFRSRSPGQSGHHFNRSRSPNGSYFNQSSSPCTDGAYFNRSRSPIPKGSHLNRSKSPGPNAPPFNRTISIGPSILHFNKSRNSGPNGSYFNQSNSHGPDMPHFSRPRSPGPDFRERSGSNRPRFRSRSPGPNQFRSHSPGPNKRPDRAGTPEPQVRGPSTGLNNPNDFNADNMIDENSNIKIDLRENSLKESEKSSPACVMYPGHFAANDVVTPLREQIEPVSHPGASQWENDFRMNFTSVDLDDPTVSSAELSHAIGLYKDPANRASRNIPLEAEEFKVHHSTTGTPLSSRFSAFLANDA